MLYMPPSLEEFSTRRKAFITLMNAAHPDWETALFASSVHQYYFTGTMQDGLVIVQRSDGSLRYAVRRSYERARMESPLAETELMPMPSYRALDALFPAGAGALYVEGDTLPLAALERMKKHLPFSSLGFLDAVIRKQRSLKSAYELEWIRRCGALHRDILENYVPSILREGMSEAELAGSMLAEMYRRGYQGLIRFYTRTEVNVGQLGFGTNSLYPSSFDGPGGAKGHGPAAPFSADGEKRLAKGEIAFVDVPFALNGYHTDKTQIYMLGNKAPPDFTRAHELCLDIEKRVAERLIPGEIPSKIYEDIMNSLSPDDAHSFMGVNQRHQVKFLGHGVGLQIDEFPVIARGFDEPLEENMVFAIEPKKGVAGTGMAGIENTYIVTPEGGVCVSGGASSPSKGGIIHL
ncbi:MAG: M24 family metallopeptidase [Spirochaetaceae bacterium]|jgi:Xaa-Pro aminopeptidase|nr:M24 family metallopeptidase [Spirochaetaceae bacterium]